MDSQRLLLAPRSFLYAVEEARASCSFRMAFASAADSPDSLPGFFLDISDVSAGRVMFIFLNTAPEDYVISHVYFDDGEPMVIDVVRDPANDSQAMAQAGNVAVAGEAIRAPGQHLHENLAVTFDLRDGVGMADIICALNDERLRVRLKAARPDGDETVVFTCEPVLTLSHASL